MHKAIYALFKHWLAKVLSVLLDLAGSIKQSFPLLALLTFSHTGAEKVKIACLSIFSGAWLQPKHYCERTWPVEQQEAPVCRVIVTVYSTNVWVCLCVSPCVR